MNSTLPYLPRYESLRQFDLLHDDLARKVDRLHFSLSLIFFFSFVTMILLCARVMIPTRELPH